MQGKVVFFSAAKGWGFISRGDGEKDLFVHWTSITGMEGYKKLDQGDVVEFEVEQGKNGPQACNVTVVK